MKRFMSLLNRDESEEEMSEYDSDLEGSSEKLSQWGSLPHVCLRKVFRLLGDKDRMSADLVCHHWHNVMSSPSLWRYRFFSFSGRVSKYTQSEYCSAVAYVRSRGVYMEKLEVCVIPPRKSLKARRLENTLTGLLYELTRVKAPLKSISLSRLELDRSSWNTGQRKSIVSSLIDFLQRGGSKLTAVCLQEMRNNIRHGLKLLTALEDFHRRYIYSLDLRGFFSSDVYAGLTPSLPNVLRCLQGLADLQLSYSCLSDELLLALQNRHSGTRRRSNRNVMTLQTLSLHCSVSEPHAQVVCEDSWAALASSSPGLEVKLVVKQVIHNFCLRRILLPRIPLTDFSMTAFCSPDEEWSAKPLLRDMLPRYRASLQYLTLDLCNCSEFVDEELLELVRVCERLEQLRVWAFLDVSFVGKLLQIVLTQRRSLNKIRVRIYSDDDDTTEQEDQLEEMMSSHPELPAGLEFYVSIYPFM